MTYYGIKREEGRLGSLKIGTKDGAQEVLTGSATEAILQNVAKGTITSFTASFAKITTLDVETINSITTTTQSLEVADALIVAASGANSLAADNGGLQIGGTAGSDSVASFLYDHSTKAMEVNFAGVTAVEVVSGSAFRPDTDDLYDLGASGKEWKDLYIDGIAYIDDLRADQLGAALDANNQVITNINVDSGDISGADITVGGSKTLDVSAGTLTLANDQISGDKVEGGTINATTINTLTSTNLQATNLKANDGTSAGSIADSTGVVTLASSVLTTTDINGGTIDGANITVGASKELDVSAGTLTTSAAQKLAIMQGANSNVDIGTFSLTANTLVSDVSTGTAPLTVSSTTLVSNLNADKLDGQEGSYYTDFSNQTVDAGEIDASKVGAGTFNAGTFSFAGSTISNLGSVTTVDLNGGTIDGATMNNTVIGGTTAAAASFTTVSASSHVSASSFEVDGQASISYDTSALDFSSGGAGAKLSTTMFSASVELQGPTLEVSGAAKVGSLTLGGTAVTSNAAELNLLDGVSGLIQADFTKLAAVDASAAELNLVDGSSAGSIVNSKAVIYGSSGEVNATTLQIGGSSITATAAELNLMDGDTSAGTTAVANGDAIVTNDGGTMRQTTVQTFQTYFDANSVGGGNIVTVGALGAGSISSGFGSIDIGTDSLKAGPMSASVGMSGSTSQFGSFVLGGSSAMTAIKDEDNMASNAEDALATQQSIKAYVDSQVSAGTAFAIADSDGGSDTVTIGTDTLTFAQVSNETTVAVTDNTVTIGLPDDVTIADDLKLGSDEAVLNFGADSDVKLTHVHDTGLLLNDAMKLQFRDSAIHISSDADGFLNAQADTGVNLNIGGTDVLAVTSAGATLADSTDLLAGGDACDIGSTTTPFANVYATNVITGDFHMKNERGDWTLFEESDHIRIRNNKTGQTFKMGMTLIEE